MSQTRADEDQAHGVPVVVVPHLFKAGCLQPVGLVDDEQLGAASRAGFGVHVGVDDAVLGVVQSEGNLLARARQALVDLPDGRGHSGCEECGPGFEDPLGDGPDLFVDGGLPCIPVVDCCVVACRECFSDSRRSLAQSEVPVSADGIGELGESAVLPRGQERGLVRGQWRGTFVDLAEAALQEAAAVILSVEKTRLADVNRFHTHAARVGVEVQERSTCLEAWEALRGWSGIAGIAGQGIGETELIAELLLELAPPLCPGAAQLLEGDRFGRQLRGDGRQRNTSLK